VVATGINENEAKTDLCRAIADRKIAIRVTIAAGERGIPGSLFYGDNIQVPTHLKPEDFDWVQSRPSQRWRLGPSGPQSYIYPYWDWDLRPIDRIELATADVQEIFGSPQSQPAQTSQKPKVGRRSFGPAIRQAVFGLMDWHGDLSGDDPEWSAQADVERAVREQLGDSGPRAVSTVRDHVSSAITEWRNKKLKADN
jgi:hypothetical protein